MKDSTNPTTDITVTSDTILAQADNLTSTGKDPASALDVACIAALTVAINRLTVAIESLRSLWDAMPKPAGVRIE